MGGAHFSTGDAYSGPVVPGPRRCELMGRAVGVFGQSALEIEVDDGWAAFARMHCAQLPLLCFR